MKIFQRHPKSAVAFLLVTGLVVGHLGLIDVIYWAIAEKVIVRMKENVVGHESPFLLIPQEERILETENAFVVESPHKEAPVHVLIIPKKRIANITEADSAVIGEMFMLLNKVVDQYGIRESGFRTVINTNPHGAQTVYHLHLHVMGGRQMRWPPG